MTTTQQGLRPVPVRARPQVQVLLDQLCGIDAWSRAHATRAAGLAEAGSREARLDLARRRDVVERQRQALQTWTDRDLRGSGDLLRSLAAPRAVVCHRQEWFSGALVRGLEAGGVVVVAALENGADAVGVAVAEQPDLLVLEERLPMVSGLQVTAAAVAYAPGTAVVVQVADPWQIGPFLDAGASAVYTRRTPPADIVVDLLARLGR